MDSPFKIPPCCALLFRDTTVALDFTDWQWGESLDPRLPFCRTSQEKYYWTQKKKYWRQEKKIFMGVSKNNIGGVNRGKKNNKKAGQTI